MSHSPYISRHITTSPISRPPLRLNRIIEQASPARLTTTIKPVIRPVPIIEERRTSFIGSPTISPAIRSIRVAEELSPTVKVSRSLLIEERPSLITPIERPLLRARHVVEDISPVAVPVVKRQCVREMRPVEVIRGRSVEPIHRGVISNKVPVTFGHTGVTVHPMPFASLQGEDKVVLYSEVERLSLLNLELKRQLDAIYAELEDQRHMASRVPDLEVGIHDLQREIIVRDQDFTDVVREHEMLRADHENLSRLGPAYNELLDHNKVLISEVDGLNGRLTGILHERDVLEIQAESVKLLQPRLEDAANRIDIMAHEIVGRDEEIADQRIKIQELMAKLEAMVLENDQVHQRGVDYLKDRDLLALRIEEMEKAHVERMEDLRVELENANRAVLEHETMVIQERYNTDVLKKEEELAQVNTLIHSFESKMMILATEVEHLEKINLSKASEIDALKMRIALVEEEKHDAIKVNETEMCIKMDRHLAQQRSQYEGNILQLKKELGEAERTKVMLKQKDNEIELWKTQIENNERVWEMRLQKTVDNEVKSACNKYVLEMTAIETEASMNKDSIIKLENQINFLTAELERTTYAHNQKIIEMNELQRKLTSQEMTYKLSTEELKTKAEIEKKRSLEELRKDMERVHIDRMEEMRRFQSSLEERLMIIADENTRLSAIVEDRTKDVDNYSVKIRVMEDVYKQQVDEIHKKSSFSQKLAVDKEVSSATLKHKSEKSELENKLAFHSVDLERLRTQNQVYGSEIERLTQTLEDKELELQQEKRRYVELEIQRTRDISELREQFDSYKRANIDVNTLQIRFEAERASLSSQILQHREKISELEKRLSLVFGENDKLKDLYTEKATELELFRQKHREEEENWHNERINLENENEYLKRSNLDGKESMIKSSSERTQYENQIRQLKTINENGKQELEKLYELMNQRKQEHDYYIKQNDELKKDVDRMSRQLRDAGSETSTRKGKHEEFERTIVDLERDRDLYKEHNERLNTQLKQTHAELQEKIKEIDATKKKYDESILKLSTQLDKDLMKKLMGSPVRNVSSPQKERASFSGVEF